MLGLGGRGEVTEHLQGHAGAWLFLCVYPPPPPLVHGAGLADVLVWGALQEWAHLPKI